METNNTNGKKRDVYSIVSDRILQQLDKGIVPWRQPWISAGPPQNLITKRNYRGINLWLLLMLNFARNFFLTAKQLKEVGGEVKKDEKPALVVYWNWKEATDDTSGETKMIPFLRYYLVYNVDQCDGIPKELIPEDYQRINNPIASCEKVILEMPQKPEIKHKEDKAYYNPLLDFINMPKRNSFNSPESYYQVLFHETIHSTGHTSRLGRKELLEMAEFGSEPYSIEELTAEMGCCFLSSNCGITIDNFENNAAYIQSWMKKLKNDKRFVIYASGKAQQAVDFILKIQHTEREPEHSAESVIPAE